MKGLALAVTAFVALVGSAHAAPGPRCFRYHEQKVVLTGDLEAKTFTSDGQTARYEVLRLGVPICTERGQSEDEAPHRGVEVIAVWPFSKGDPAASNRIYKALHEAEGRRVRVMGVLSTGNSAAQEEINIAVENVEVIPATAHAGCYNWRDTVTLTGKLVRRYDKAQRAPFIGLMLKEPICVDADDEENLEARGNQTLLSFTAWTEKIGFKTTLHRLLGRTVTVTGIFGIDPMDHTPLTLGLTKIEMRAEVAAKNADTRPPWD